jgi:hypothetical protein
MLPLIMGVFGILQPKETMCLSIRPLEIPAS